MKLFFGVLLALPMVGLAQGAAAPSQGGVAPSFTIAGDVKGLAENSKVSVTDVSNPTDTVASTMVKEGKFVLSGHVTEPNLYEINFDAAKKKVPLFMGNDKMSISGDVEDIAGLKTAGSLSNDDFVAFQATFTPYF